MNISSIIKTFKYVVDRSFQGMGEKHFKKYPPGSKGRAFMQNKNSSQRNIQHYNILQYF